jgi:kinesin family protein C1
MQNSSKTYQVTPGSYDKYLNCTIQWTPSPSPTHTPDGLPPTQRRNPSISTLMSKMSLSEPKDAPNEQVTLANKARKTPLRSGNTRIPLRQAKSTSQLTHTPSRRKPKSPKNDLSVKVPFLTKSSQLKAWEHDSRLQELESFADTFFSKISQVGQNSDVMKDAINLYKSRGTCSHDGSRSSLTIPSGRAREKSGRALHQQLHASY